MHVLCLMHFRVGKPETLVYGVGRQDGGAGAVQLQDGTGHGPLLVSFV